MTRALLILAVLTGCDAQVDPAYPGDALAHLRGTVVGLGVDETSGAAAIVWNANRGADVPAGPMTHEPLQTRFPARVTISILAEPPEDAFFAIDGEDAAVAEGYIYLMREDERGVLGMSLDLVLVHVRGAVAPGSLTADYLGGPLAPGYHVLEWRATAELTAAQRYFTDRCAASKPYADCRRPRLYRFLPTEKDLETPLLFTPRSAFKR